MEYEEEQYDERMLTEVSDVFALSEAQWNALTPAEQAEYEKADEVAEYVSLPASADPDQPLSAAPAMNAALDEIASGAPASRTNPNERGLPVRLNPAAALRAMVQSADAEARRQVEADRKAEADRAAATGHATGFRREKRARNPSANSPTDSGKKAKASHPVPDHNAMDIDLTEAKPAKRRPKSFEHFWKPVVRPCAARIGGPGDEIMGDPITRPPGWDLKVSIDPGKLGLPSIGLNFKFAKDGIDSKRDPNHYNSFAVGWEPGVKIGSEWMMENMIVERAANPSDPNMKDFTFPPEIQKLCKNQDQIDSLFCMVFKSNVHKTSAMDVDWAKSLGKDNAAPFNNLRRMYSATDPSYMVTLWFTSPTYSIDGFLNGCLQPLANAVEDHTPPFHQYLDENDEPILDFDRLPTVKDIGNGMYLKYPKVTDAKGKKVQSVQPSYLTLPKTVTWDSIKSFRITFGVPIVRDGQFNDGLYVRLEDDWHGCFIQKMPNLEFDGRNLEADPIMRDAYQIGVRMARDRNTGLKHAIPEAGSIITFDFHNGTAKKGHETIKGDICLGRVEPLGGKDWLDKTGTDFCVVMSKPRRSTAKLHPYAFARNVPDSGLTYAKLRVKINRTAAYRDMDALKKFCDPEFAPELLDPIRLAFWSDPSKTGIKTDLTMGPAHDRSEENKKSYDRILIDMKRKRKTNRSQDDVLWSASHMRSNITVVQGPPGAGKTRTLRDKAIALAKIGHKIACVASSNVAVDTDAEAVWRGLSPEDRKVIKCLRLETDGAERAQRLIKANYAFYTGAQGEADKPPEYIGAKEAQDNPAIRNALDSLCLAFATRQEYAAKMVKQYDNLNDSYKAVQNYDGMKRSNVPTGMTLDYRMFEIREEDKQQAILDYEEAKSQLTPEEYTRRVANGEMTIAMFDKSRKYEDCIRNYRAKNGKVTRQERRELEDETDIMVERVLAETVILFTTASNCGGALLEESRSFVPTVLFCDETGQISIASLCVPLTTFEKWEGIFLFGDIQQLEPTAISGRYNEFILNAKMSPLSLLAIKDFETEMLDEQYRMSPACSSFPREQFYDGKGLKDSAEVTIDNEIRETMRATTLRLNVTGDKGQGSEYVVTDVKNGCSRVELNGTSLVNYANADCIINMITRFLLTRVIKASMIKVLVYYQGQRRLLKRKIAETEWTPEQKAAIEISTVDSFQGREARIIIVDMVAAKDNLVDSTVREEDTAEDDEDIGTEDYVKVGTVTGHVRSPNRLNVALTRGRDATIVLCQAALLVASTRKKRGKQYNAPANMIGNARDRNCLFEDSTEDSHPDSVALRQQLGEKRVADERAAKRRTTLDFIAEGRANWKMLSNLAAIPKAAPFKHYRTRQGHTTRPIGNPELVAKADAHDAELEANRIEAARVASIATAEAEAENKRALDLALKESLGSSQFPPLPPAAIPDLSVQATNTTANDEYREDSSSDETDWQADDKSDYAPGAFSDEEGEGKIGSEFGELEAGEEEAQFG